ncbi:MAG: endonuclease/exonuclease/phosphatase family protein [Phycisphaerales bacterium]
MRLPLVTLVALGLAPLAVASGTIRVATFNCSLNRNNAGELLVDLSTPNNAQAATVAEIVQRVAPDIVLLNEFDYYPDNVAAGLFQANYLSVSHNGSTPIEYPYVFVAPSNTGVPSGFDLDNNGSVGGPNDALGFGFFPGQYGMAIYSKFPIDEAGIRTFQNFLWKDMPGALLPDLASTRAPGDWYSPEELAIFPLSSKSHWDVPVTVAGQTVHILASHPTPPVFDGPEDRNGLRNHDEIRLWADYVTPGAGDYIYDDVGVFGGLEAGAKFVICGDQNADPLDGDSADDAVLQLIQNPMINDTLPPGSAGGPEAAVLQRGANATHLGNPYYDTADFADTTPGNLRADYVLPSWTIPHVGGGIFWPTTTDPLFYLTGVFPFPSSDHRLVWADLAIPSDLNADGAIDAADLGILLGNWGGSGAGDLDASGTVDAADLAILLGNWTA